MGTMARAARSGYDTDLTEEQWALVEPFVRAEYSGLGPYHRVSRRAVVDAILYQNRTGCQWRLLPRDFPNWHTVRHYYDTWRADGTWEALNEALNALVRAKAGKEPTPSVLIVDSQSARTTEMGGEVGVDGGKKVKGRKRQLAVDTMGLLWRVRVHAANVADCVGGWLLLEGCVGRFARLVKVLADGAYGRGDLWERVRDELGCDLDVAERPAGATTFVVQRARWIVEQSIACLGRDRRLAKDYEYTTSSSEARVLIAAIGRSLHRLAPGRAQRHGYTRSAA